ncbi:MAG: hypothetical protein VKJ64_03510 [Leptolyngbyaceae bacterium]|nr:hypothetical protein [Leptolyngbyaceae bacterium]
MMDVTLIGWIKRFVILDGSQRSLRHLGWFIDLFREPYSRVYAAGCVQTWLENAGFGTVKTRHLGLIYQLTVGSV